MAKIFFLRSIPLLVILILMQETVEQLRQDLAKRTHTILGLQADVDMAQQVSDSC